MKRLTCFATLVGLVAASGAYAQIGTINSTIATPRVWNDIPAATLTSFNSYPSLVLFGEQNVSGSGYANRDIWQFSNNGGTSAYQFQNNDYFNASMSLTLSGGSGTYYPEAGFLFSGSPGFTGGDLQFIVKTDGEVVQFGGTSFFNFNPTVVYTPGTAINLKMSYFQALDGNNALEFFANGQASTVFEFAPGAGIGGSTGGGYFQIPQNPTDPSNSGSASFGSISIVPEPSALALLGLGIVALVFRRRG